MIIMTFAFCLSSCHCAPLKRASASPQPPSRQLQAATRAPILQPSPLQAEPAQLLQHLLTHLVLQPSPARWPPLGSVQDLSLSLVLGRPKLGMVLQVQSHQCQTEGKITAIGLLAALLLTAQDAVVGFCCKSMLLTCQLYLIIQIANREVKEHKHPCQSLRYH